MSTRKRRPVRALVTLVILIAAAAGALVAGNLTQGVSYAPALALDLQGGTQLILRPTSTEQGDRAITEQDINQAISIIRNRIDASGVSESEISSLGNENIVVAIPGTPTQETLDLIRSSSQMNFRPVLQIGLAATRAQPTTPGQIDASGAQSGAVAPQGMVGGQSGAVAPQDAVEGQSGQIVSTALDPQAAKLQADLNGDGEISDQPLKDPTGPSDLQWKTEQAMYDFLTLDCTDKAVASHKERDAAQPYAACDDSGTIKYLLGPVSVAGANLDSAAASQVHNDTGQTTGQWGVDLQFDSTGTQAFADSSKTLFSFQNVDTEGTKFFNTPDRNHFAVVLDGTVITAPSMNAVISNGRAQITGNFTAASSTALANQLNFGSLPLNFEVQSEQQISATLGSDHLQKGMWAGLIGFILVIMYLIWQYRGLAIISAGSLLVASVMTYFVIALLSWIMGYRLSLAGVAGLIMAVGVTTDSFIVYFERIRDEVRDGRPLQVAVDEGWDRAKRTIVVSDAVNLVAAIVLYLLAVGGVQGFAFTLGVTTVIDLVVIFWFTHPMMELLIRTEFFGQGHTLSGLDAEHLGAKSALVYAGRGRVTHVKGERSSVGDDRVHGHAVAPTTSIAERRRAERLAAQKTVTVKAGESVVDESTTEQKGEAE